MNALGALLEILLWAGLIGGLWWYIVYVSKQRYESATFTGKSGERYTYVIGDRLHYGYTEGLFSGIDIVLPAALPNMYLDGTKGHGGRGPRHYYLREQTLQLEGDFNNSFNCYVPKDYQVLALSILTPDIMQTVLDTVPDSDVEFRLMHLRIIVDHKVYGRPEAMAALLKAAKAVLAQVDEKLQSWSAADSWEAAGALLASQDVPMHKIFGRNFRLTTIIFGPLYGVLGVVIWWAILTVSLPAKQVTLGWLVSTYWLPFLFFPCLWLVVLYVVPSRWFSKVLQRLDR